MQTSINSLCNRNFTECLMICLLCLTYVFNAFATTVCWDPRIFAKRFVLRTFYSKFLFLCDGKVCLIIIFQFVYLRARARNGVSGLLFLCRKTFGKPYHWKERRQLDDCELLCYLNDQCVSLNFEKDPENNRPLHICELNNATHLKYDSHLTTNATFYYRGSKVSYKSIFRSYRLWIIQ